MDCGSLGVRGEAAERACLLNAGENARALNTPQSTAIFAKVHIFRDFVCQIGNISYSTVSLNNCICAYSP